MGKYDPLSAWLRRRREVELELSFREIEARIRCMLPNNASRADWWESHGEPGPRDVHKLAWRAAGFDAALLSGERVCFTRLKVAHAT